MMGEMSRVFVIGLSSLVSGFDDSKRRIGKIIDKSCTPLFKKKIFKHGIFLLKRTPTWGLAPPRRSDSSKDRLLLGFFLISSLL
jgi:hypothetical protein